MMIRLPFFLQWSVMLLLVAGAANAQNKTITLQGSGDAGSSETISLAADANVGVTVNEDGIVVTLPVNVRVKCYGDETEDGYCLLAVSDGTGNPTNEPLSPLIPAFSAPSSKSNGFTVQITNFDPAFTWTESSNFGTPSINSSGLLTVTGLSAGASATVTVTTNRSGYATGTASTTGQATNGSTGNLDGLTPSFGSPSPQSAGFTVQITNYDSAYDWSESTDRGSVTRNSSGLLTVSGLSPEQSATVKVTTSRQGYNSASNSITGRASGGSTGNEDYCSGRPSGVSCSASFNLDDMYGNDQSYEVVINAKTIRAIPFTLKDVGSSPPAVFNLETFTDEAVLGGSFKLREWFSKTPGGDPVELDCDGYASIARYTTKVYQQQGPGACSLPASGGTFYVNYAVTCQFGLAGCESVSDMYQYGSRYTFFLERYAR